MKLRTRNSFIASILASLLLAVAIGGCGGKDHKPNPGHPPAPGNSSPPSVSSGLIKGGHSHAVSATKTTAWSIGWDGLVPTVEAQSTTVLNVAQNWEGLCSSNPTTSDPISIVVFGIGQNADPTCSHEFFENDLTGANAAASAISGKFVTGNGTLSNLFVNTEKGTVIRSSSGIPITVYVRRGADTLPTGLTCSLPANGADELTCASTATFALLNGDHVIVTESLSGTDTVVNLNVTFTKSTP